jgi:hypothetical protein
MNTPTIIDRAMESFREEFVVLSNAGTGLLRYTDADKITAHYRKHLLLAIKDAFEKTGVEEKGEHAIPDGLGDVWNDGHDAALRTIKSKQEEYIKGLEGEV